MSTKVKPDGARIAETKIEDLRSFASQTGKGQAKRAQKARVELTKRGLPLIAPVVVDEPEVEAAE